MMAEGLLLNRPITLYTWAPSSTRATSRRRTVEPSGLARTMIAPNSSGEVRRPWARTEYVKSCPLGAGSPPIVPAGLTVFWLWMAEMRSLTVRLSLASWSGLTQ